MFGTEPLFGLDPFSRPVAIAEILLLLSLATIIGWLLGRLIMAGRVSALRTAIVDKETELDECRRTNTTPPASRNALIVETPDPVRLTPATPVIEPSAFVHADPIEPATSFDTTPEFIDTAPDVTPAPPDPLPVSVAVDPPMASYVPEPVSFTPPVTGAAATGNSEAAVLSRIAARANELNFDRIGRATAADADDLKDVSGVGPFLERKLHSLGIFTFRQIANFTKEDIAKVNEIIEFFPGRIERDNWVGQARGFYEQKYK